MGRMRHTSSDIGQEGMVWWGRKRAQATRFEAPCRREHLAGSTRRCRCSKFLGDVYVYESLSMLGLRLLLAVAVSQSTQARWTMGRVRRVLSGVGEAVTCGTDRVSFHECFNSILAPLARILGNRDGSQEVQYGSTTTKWIHSRMSRSRRGSNVAIVPQNSTVMSPCE
jgi:hypothetical protein